MRPASFSSTIRPWSGGLRLIVEAEPDLVVLGEAADGAEPVEQAAAVTPDVVLMDIRMPVLDGIAATERVLERVPTARVVMLTTFDTDECVVQAFRAGASGFILKTAPPEQLVSAFRTTVSGDALLAPASTRPIIEQASRVVAPSPRLATLSSRELEVLRLLTRGLSNAEIAHELLIEVHGQDPRRQPARQTRRPRSRPSSRLRLRERGHGHMIAGAQVHQPNTR